jgi:Tol biopolymer transport system component
MKWFNSSKMRLVLIGFIVTHVFGDGTAKADYTFGTPTNLGPTVNRPAQDWSPSIPANGLELYFESGRVGGYGGWDLWVTTRETIHDDWGAPMNLGSTINSEFLSHGVSISLDGLSLYFASNEPGGSGDLDIWFTTRPTISDPWVEPINLGPIVNSSVEDMRPSISADELSIFFTSKRSGGYGGFADIWVTTRASLSDPWEAPENLGPIVNSSFGEGLPSISADGRKLFFSDYGFEPFRPGGYGSHDLWITTRETKNDSWGTPVNLGPPVNSSATDVGPCISPDESTLYFSSDRPGGSGGIDLWQVSIEPVVDINGDGIVDAADMCIIVDHWGENYPLCDIGPTPLGDGVVDVQDLIVLAEHLFEEIFPPGLVAYWKLDETEGNLAYNSIGDNHGIIHEEPLWQPQSGKKGGALELDGVNDYVDTDFVMNPAESAFSTFVWIKGGMPGQVIISQTDGPGGAGEIWLGADAAEGKLMTKLRAPSGRSPAPPMVADVVITDGQWHHVGIVVTEQKIRNLYVDGIRVAFDSQPVVLPSSDGGLHIGSGKNLDGGTFFSGLVDDVRIYNVALATEEVAALTE